MRIVKDAHTTIGVAGDASIWRRTVLALAGVLALMLALAPLAADTGVSWMEIDREDLPAELQPWFDASIADRGIYVLPAGHVRYLLIAWGEKPSSGYSVEVSSVEQGLAADVIQVDVELVAPEGNGVQTATYPHALVELPPGDQTVHVNFSGAAWLEGELAEEPEDDDVLVLMDAIERDDGTVPNPLVVEGRARVFEATMQLVLEDGHVQLRNHWLTLAAGGPAWAEFAVALTYDDPTSAQGTVIAAWDDAETGQNEILAHVPVVFGSASVRLADVEGHWAEGSIRLGVAAGFIHGYPDKTFLAENTVIRAEFIKMLAVGTDDAAGETETGDLPFADTEGHWAAPYVAYALDQGWVAGSEEGDMFRPNEVVTRQEMARWGARAASLSEVDGDPDFTDAAAIDDEFKAWVMAAADSELILGYPDGTFRPVAGLTRGESVTVVWRSLRLQSAME